MKIQVRYRVEVKNNFAFTIGMFMKMIFFIMVIISMSASAFGQETRKVYSEGEVPSVGELVSIFGEENQPTRQVSIKPKPRKVRSFRDASMVEGSAESNITVEQEPVPETKVIVEKQQQPVAVVTKPVKVSIPIQFKINSDVVEFSEKNILKNIAVAMCQVGDKAKFLIEGHTDSKGSEDYNLLLSVRRAKSVKNQLVKYGVKQEQLVITGVGSSFPLNENAPMSRENRRVEFKKLQ